MQEFFTPIDINKFAGANEYRADSYGKVINSYLQGGDFPDLAGGGPKFTNVFTDQDGYATALPIKANSTTGTFYVTATINNQTVKFSLTNAQTNQ